MYFVYVYMWGCECVHALSAYVSAHVNMKRVWAVCVQVCVCVYVCALACVHVSVLCTCANATCMCSCAYLWEQLPSMFGRQRDRFDDVIHRLVAHKVGKAESSDSRTKCLSLRVLVIPPQVISV